MKLQRLEILILGLLIALVVGVYALLFRMVGDRIEQGNPERSLVLLQPQHGTLVHIGALQVIEGRVIGGDLARLELWVNDMPVYFAARSLPAGDEVWSAGDAWAVDTPGWNRLDLRAFTTGGDAITATPVHVFAVPSGEILFLSNRGGTYSLYRVSSDGSALHAVLENERDVTGLAVGSHGEVVIVKATQDGLSSIWRADLSAGTSLPLLYDRWSYHSPAWSPGGAYLAYISDRSGQEQIWVADGDGNGARQITDAREAVADPSWGPDERVIVYSALREGSWQLIVHELEGGAERQLTHDDSHKRGPAWSPTGGLIAYVSDRSGQYQIHMVRPEDGEERQITYLAGGAQQPSWSHDGNWLLFSGNDQAGHPGSAGDLYLFCATDGGWARVTYSIYDDIRPTWSDAGTTQVE